jgi:hypothetical protein
MTTEKLNKILKALDGISYLDWVELEREVYKRFNADIRLISDAIPLRDTDKIFKELAKYDSNLRQSE